MGEATERDPRDTIKAALDEVQRALRGARRVTARCTRVGHYSAAKRGQSFCNKLNERAIRLRRYLRLAAIAERGTK